MELWIPVTIAAAFAQNLRFMLQKSLSATRLSASGATFARFIYSAPLVALLMVVYMTAAGLPLPKASPLFWAYALGGGLAQILATVCVVVMFKHRNFAVGITLKKTEVIQTALAGFLILGDRVSAGGLGAISLGLVAVLILADPPQAEGRFLRRIVNRAAGLGLLSGVFFALSAVGYRGATLSLATDDVFLRAGLTLAFVTASQTLGMAAWLAWRDPGQIGRVLAAWRVAGLVGLTSMAGSLGWFTAFTLQSAAYVFALGQVEVLFSYAASVLVFRETVTRREGMGIVLLTCSIILLVWIT